MIETKAVISEPRVCVVAGGAVVVGLLGMTGRRASIAIQFTQAGHVCGLDVGFHVSTEEARELARHLLRFADAADAGQAQQQQVAA